MDPKVIVSLTTHDLRLTNGTVERVIKNILDGTFKELRVVLTLYKDDESLIPATLRKMIDDGSIELIVSDINLRPHLKYFYAMQKYRNLPVITIDDDILYPDDMVEKLYKRWTENPRYIIARRSFPIVTTYYGELTRYATWMAQGLIKSEAPLMAAFPTGVGGILYPPDCLQLSDADIPEIKTILTDDDFYLKAIEVRKCIRTITIEHNEADLYKKNLDDQVTQSIALFNQNAIGGSDKSILKYRSDFIEATKHNIELPIISLTSWKGRIDRVYLTILSILTNCPGFKIVLVLSEEEFPKREEELPKELLGMVSKQYIELLWVKRNWKSYKKFLFTSEKYKHSPIISADDDCEYESNFAIALYTEWLKKQDSVIRYSWSDGNYRHAVSGPWTIYPPFEKLGRYALEELKTLPDNYIEESLDDDFYCYIIGKYHLKFDHMNNLGLLKFHSQDKIAVMHENHTWKDPK